MLKIENLNKSFDRPIFKNFNVVFPDTGFIFLVGENGTGKSTLINIILGLTNLDSGHRCRLRSRDLLFRIYR